MYGTKHIHATGGNPSPPGMHATEDQWEFHDTLKDAKGKNARHHKMDINQGS